MEVHGGWRRAGGGSFVWKPPEAERGGGKTWYFRGRKEVWSKTECGKGRR